MNRGGCAMDLGEMKGARYASSLGGRQREPNVLLVLKRDGRS